VLTSRTASHPLRRAIAATHPPSGWLAAGAAALLCSTVALASLPQRAEQREDRQWQALGIAPMANGGGTGVRMAPTDAALAIEVAPARATPFTLPKPVAAKPVAQAVSGPLRIRGQVGDGLYWSLRAAGASPQVAASYLSALASEIDVGDVGPADGFDLVLGPDHALLYAGLRRVASSSVQLVHWNANGRSEWIDAATVDRPAEASSGLAMPAQGPITSSFGYRFHPILHFSRLHAGIDIGAGWGSPIVAAADGRVTGAGWAGGYGREVEIAHGAGITTRYGHMSAIVAQAGSFVRRGQVIGYVGASGLATAAHLHFEVRQGGTPVNPLGVRFASTPVVDTHLAEAVKARLKALLSVGVRG